MNSVLHLLRREVAVGEVGGELLDPGEREFEIAIGCAGTPHAHSSAVRSPVFRHVQ